MNHVIAVAGGGHWGPHLIRNFYDHESSEVAWIVEPRPDRREALARRFRDSQTTPELGQALRDPRVSGVVVATPTTSHYELVKRCLEAGKHVLVEKPLATSVKTGLEICELAAERQLVLMVGHVFLFNPSIIAVKKLLGEGHLGELYYMSMLRTNLGPVRSDVNAAWDLASHDISIANYWLGSTPKAVTASGGSWLNSGVHDTVFLTLHYPDSILVHIHASWLNPRKSRFITVVGSTRMLTVNDMDLSEPVRVYDKGVETGPEFVTDTFAAFRAQIRDGTILIPAIQLGEPLKAECDDFLRRIEAGTHGGVSDGWDGLEVVRTLESADVSMREDGRLVPVSVSA